MSLPNRVIFYKNEIEVNCGWICNINTVKNAIKRTLMMSDEKFDWDIAKAYGMEISKEEFDSNKLF